jgi:zinc transporter ZupT
LFSLTPPQGEQAAAGAAAAVTHSRTPPAVVEIMESDHHSFMLKKMGLLTGIAIFIHNFPEGEAL